MLQATIGIKLYVAEVLLCLVGYDRICGGLFKLYIDLSIYTSAIIIKFKNI